MKRESLYTDRDYLESRFSSLEEKLDAVIESMEKVGGRVTDLETDIRSAKLLGRAALGAAAIIGGVMTWAADLGGKIGAIVSSR
jgi:hypothetical protein